MDFDIELNHLADYLKGKREYIIFAKSAGVALALKGISEEKINPARCIFLGTPVNWAKENNIQIEEWIYRLKANSVFVQKKDDPAISAGKLKEFLDKNRVRNYIFKEIHGDNHHYDDISQIRKFMIEFLMENNK